MRRQGRVCSSQVGPCDSSELVALGRQVITVMSCVSLIAAGYLSGRVELAYLVAWWAFAAGAWWIWLVDHPRKSAESKPARGPRPCEPPGP